MQAFLKIFYGTWNLLKSFISLATTLSLPPSYSQAYRMHLFGHPQRPYMLGRKQNLYQTVGHTHCHYFLLGTGIHQKNLFLLSIGAEESSRLHFFAFTGQQTVPRADGTP